MSWIDDLDEHSYNFLIDELVWHLRESRTVISIRKEQGGGDGTGFRFLFRGHDSQFLSVNPDFLDSHWNEAQQITRRFSQLERLTYETS